MGYTYHVSAIEAAHQAFLDLIDAQLPTNPATISIHDSGDVKLAEVVLGNPGGSVDSGTGQLTLTIATQEDAALADGAASYGRMNDGAGNEKLRLDAEAGTSPVSGAIVLRSLTIVVGAPVEVLSATIG